MILVSMVVVAAHGCCCFDDNYAFAGKMYGCISLVPCVKDRLRVPGKRFVEAWTKTSEYSQTSQSLFGEQVTRSSIGVIQLFRNNGINTVFMFLFVCNIFLNTHTYFILIVEAFASLLRPHQQLNISCIRT